MEVVFDSGTGEQEVWVFVKEGSRIELGAQLVPKSQPTDLAVVWRASVKCAMVQSIVSSAYQVLPNRSQSYQGRLTGYGPTKEFLHLQDFMARTLTPDFDAYRAELETPEDAVVFWANVRHGDDRGLEEAPDNIGIRVPFRSSAGWAGGLIADAVSSTRNVSPTTAREWLDAIIGEFLVQGGSRSSAT